MIRCDSPAQQEGRLLSVLLPAATLLEGVEATESVLRAVQRPVILHLATHGFLSSEEILQPSGLDADSRHEIDPMLRSGVVLARASAAADGNDDGYMTASEMSTLDLTGTRLVVLSACNNGFGEVHSGEVVYGLRRALMLVGAETQVTSLWWVMARFYTNPLAGQGRSAVLCNAQLSLLADSAIAHPRSWAPFISLGDWCPVELSHRISRPRASDNGDHMRNPAGLLALMTACMSSPPGHDTLPDTTLPGDTNGGHGYRLKKSTKFPSALMTPPGTGHMVASLWFLTSGSRPQNLL